MKIAYTLWTWLMDEYNDWKPPSTNPKRDFEQSLREASDLRYPAFENFNVIVSLFEDSPEEFEKLVSKYGVEFVCIYHYFTPDFDADISLGERCCKFLVRHKAKYMNIQAPWSPPSGTTKKELDEMVDKLTILGKLCQKYDVTLCLHPHYGSTVYTEQEIDYIMQRVPDDLVNLCMDTAHTTLAGMDPVVAFEKYIKRIRYVHLKDVDPVLSAKGDTPMRGFVALGQGVIGFRSIVETLKKGGYDSFLTVECDYQRVCNYETALVSKNYIHQVLDML